MGMMGIVSLIAGNNALAAAHLLHRHGGVPQRSASGGGPKAPHPIAESARESIIRNAISRARPIPFGITGFDICPVTQACEMLGAKWYNCGNSAYDLLDQLHCVGYFSIPREIRARIPDLVREATNFRILEK